VPYSIEIFDDEIHEVPVASIEGEFETEAEALNWAYYYMGVWRAPKAKLVRIEEIGDDAPQKPEDVVAEINSGGYEKKFGQRRVPT